MINKNILFCVGATIRNINREIIMRLIPSDYQNMPLDGHNPDPY